MSELQNPLFDEEKEFLERKKLEYERALRGDVAHLKEQSVQVGKVAAVGAGLAGGIWLIIKVLSGRSKRRRRRDTERERNASADYNGEHDEYFDDDRHDDRHEADYDDQFGANYFTAGNGQRYRSKFAPRSAADSARVFADDAEAHGPEADDAGFGSAPRAAAPRPAAGPRDAGNFEDDPFQDLPYDDSRRLPASHAFDGAGTADGHAGGSNALAARAGNSRSRLLGSVLQSLLQSDTGRMLVAQAAAVALALVTKKMSEIFPAPKNADLATAPGYASAETGFAPVVSPDFPDAQPRPESQPL